MKLLKSLILGYLIGLSIFYSYAVFDSLAWDLLYFGWAKIFDAGIIAWAVIYHTCETDYKKVVKWVYYFAYVRFAFDIQSWFTGIGVNNENVVAAIFLVLIGVISYLSILEVKLLKKCR